MQLMGKQQMKNKTTDSGWNVSTATFEGEFYIGGVDAAPRGLYFSEDGTKLYTSGSSNWGIYQWNLSTAWDITTASYFGWKGVEVYDTVPNGIYFSENGIEMFISFMGADIIVHFTLTTAWNITTAGYTEEIYLGATDTSLMDVFFRSDGLKMYVVGNQTRSIYEYDLSTAWTLSTATLLQNLSVQPRETTPRAIFIKPSGLKMYLVGDLTRAVSEYDLSTAWDITTAVYLREFDTYSWEYNNHGVYIRKSDGAKMYITGFNQDKVKEFNLTS